MSPVLKHAQLVLGSLAGWPLHVVLLCVCVLLRCPTLLLQNEVCFTNGGEQSTCCSGYTCIPDTSVQLEASLAVKVLGGTPGVCKKVSATLSA